MEQFKPPSPMSFDGGNLSENWRRWSQRLNVYLTASGGSEKPDATNVAIMLHSIGEEGLEIYNNFTFENEGDNLKLKPVLDKFQEYCNPRKYTVIERYMFWETKQREGESIDHFVTELKPRAKNCEFGDQKDMMIRDRVIFGIDNDRLKERLLRDSADPSLNRMIEICRASKASAKQMKEISEPGTDTTTGAAATAVHAVSKRKQSFGGKQSKQPQKTQHKQQHATSNKWKCRNCGKSHPKNECPAFGKQCHKCGKNNHFKNLCRSGKKSGRMNHVYDVALTEEDTDSFSDLFIRELQVGQINDTGKTGWFTILKVNNQKIQFKLDTGAEANVMPLACFEKLNRKPKLIRTNIVLSAYGGHKVKPTGKAILRCRNTDIEFYIADVKSPPILGLQTCKELQLVERTDSKSDIHTVQKEQGGTLNKSKLVEDNQDVFTGLGKFKGQYHIELDPSVQPVIHPPRKIPFSLQSRLQETLRKLEADDIIAAVDKPTEWVNSIVLVEKKNGSLRVCLDPRDLNTAIKRQHYRIPTPEDISAELHDKKVFSILDEKDGYWQVELDEPSSYLCTFNTPFGRYRFKRMPFGISSASEVFQKKNQETFGDIRGVRMIADDMIIAAKDSVEHDSIITKVMERAREQNIKFNPSKIQFKVETVKYMGNVITQEGLKPDADKIEAIVSMPTPDDMPALQRLLGMVNYLSKYIPNMSEITSPLRELLKKDIAWIWDTTHDHALKVIKDVLTAKPVLNFFDQTKPVTIQADASQNGLGACLMQEGKPIAYASRSLTSAEKNYAQIEKVSHCILMRQVSSICIW
ncbi:uncharacterized protein K02A2.6-like [Mizuhopecten yessoensis]|uniref:uncharacterized protein K02A2.6-like n=1 Tax=Mizuhopecten yessoensis TaxID=6573 RepID=UPI000B45A571|nr:uncharacterized protein K02A2.6-like [Mizuhopecten yessoensis]